MKTIIAVSHNLPNFGLINQTFFLSLVFQNSSLTSQHFSRFQINADNKWITQRITTNQQLQNKVEKIKELHNANKKLLKLKKELVTNGTVN